jgi:predicted DNA-binding transcriptional regulator YafY
MRRADRLFQIVQHLRARRLTTARQLAAWLEVSERTIYRDIQDLSLSVVPLEGEAGSGYRMGREFEVRPIMFTIDEVEALVVGLRMVESWGGPALAAASRAALAKITLALPAARREEVERSRLFAPDFHLRAETGAVLDLVRRAIGEQRTLMFEYRDKECLLSARIVRPLGLYYWGATWTLAAWCEMRRDFRNFRIDRMELPAAGKPFASEPGKSLDAFIAAMRARARSEGRSRG